jgi:thioredoxin 1
MVQNVREENFKDEVLESSLPAFVCFYNSSGNAHSCVYPILKNLAEQFSGKCRFYLLNIVKSRVLVNKYDIMLTPTLMFFNKGKVHLKLSLPQQHQSLN